MSKIISEVFATGAHDKHSGDYFSIYVNPTPTDLQDIKKQIIKRNGLQAASIAQAYRRAFDNDANLYVFHAWLLHQQAQRRLDKFLPIRFGYIKKHNEISGFHFSNQLRKKGFLNNSDDKIMIFLKKASAEIQNRFGNVSIQPLEKLLQPQYERMQRLRGV